MEEVIEFDENRMVQFSGLAEDGSVKKFVEEGTKVEVRVSETSFGFVLYKDDQRIASCSFREVHDAPVEVREVIEEESPGLAEWE